MTVRKLSTTKEILRFEGRDQSAYWRRFAMLLTLSVVIATMGLIRDSGAVVIAAMLIAPLMTPILGVASAIISGRIQRVIRLLFIVCLAAGLCVLLAWSLVFFADFPRGTIVPGQVSARTDPGIEDLIVALAAGVAGAYVQIKKSEVSLLPGAAIGVALVPPLSASGILLYLGQYGEAYEAGLLFVTNLNAIILAACSVYFFSGTRNAIVGQRKRLTKFTAGVTATFAFMVVIAVQLGASTYDRFQEHKAEAILAERIAEWAGPVSIEIIRIEVNRIRRIAEVWLIVDLPVAAQYEVDAIADLLPKSLRERPLQEVVFSTLGSDYSAVIRYQTRIAGLVQFGSDSVLNAPDVEEVRGEE